MAKKLNSRADAAIRALVRDVEDLIDGEKWSLDRKAAHEWKETPWAEQFCFKGKTCRIGETTELIPEDGRVMHIAEYHDVG